MPTEISPLRRRLREGAARRRAEAQLSPAEKRAAAYRAEVARKREHQLREESYRLQDYLHKRDDVDGVLSQTFEKKTTEATQRLTQLATHFGAEPTAASDAVQVVGTTYRLATRHQSRVLYVTSREFRDLYPKEPPSQLLSPPPEEELVERERFRNAEPEVDGAKDRRANFLANELYATQDTNLVGERLVRPIGSLIAFSEWLMGRTLVYGLTHLLGTPTRASLEQLLAEFYPHLPTVSTQHAQAFVADGGLTLTDPEQFISRLYYHVPGSFETVAALIETYCDLVRATRPREAEPQISDLPEIHRPRAGREGPWNYTQRIKNTYAVTKNADVTARAFGMRAADMRAYLRNLGLFHPTRGPRAQAA